jgi:hypothetical protein
MDPSKLFVERNGNYVTSAPISKAGLDQIATELE